MMKNIRKVLSYKDNFYYWKEGDLHTKDGVIREKDIKNGIVKSNMNKEFYAFDAVFVDKIKRIKRGPQVMLEKDIGLIVTYCGLGKESEVVEAGSGCGRLSAFLGRISKAVYSYEKREDFFKLAKDNLEFLDIKNVKLKNKDIYEGIEEDGLDLVVLDLSEPWNVVKSANEKLKNGGFLVCYLPTIVQVENLVNKLKDFNDFYLDKTVELIEREWHVEDVKVRPKSKMIAHTGFLVFVRKL